MTDEMAQVERLNDLIRHYVNGDDCDATQGEFGCEVCINVGFALDAMEEAQQAYQQALHEQERDL